MSVTKRTVSSLQPTANISQVGSKQLFIATLPTGLELIYSYRTIIGFSLNGAKLSLTEEKYSSSTTSRHCSAISKHYGFRVEKLAETDFNKQLKELGYAN